MSFYIEKIIVTGSGKMDSIVELKKGVNVIYGPSNTGKTCIVRCIDYMFGSERVPLDETTGYQYVKIIVKTQKGTIEMTRKIGENAIYITSDDGSVPSGKYATKASRNNYNKTINSVWLSLLGINDMHLIISNENYKKQILSWRTFCHMFMLTETKIISEYSAILSGRDTANTAVLTSLIFLLCGQDFSETETKESKEIKEARRKAVRSYINTELFKLSERNHELTVWLKDNSNVDINQEVEDLMTEIMEYEQRIHKSIEDNQKLLIQLHEKNESLSECNVLLARYSELTTQYAADLKRLSFIVDGEANSSEQYLVQCPFCDGEVNVSKKTNYIDAAKAEYKKIKMQSDDLGKASEELLAEKNILLQQIQNLMDEKKYTEQLVEMELKPRVSDLKERLIAYKDVIECRKEIEILKRMSEQKNNDFIQNESSEESDLKFKVKEQLDYDFVNSMSEGVRAFLESSNYENLYSVVFDKADMDIIINGKKKSSNGKGYNAYLNSVVAIVLSRYMSKKAKYTPDFIVLDSPILSLKETEGKKPSETMRDTLFKDIVNNQKGIQTIVIENEIPNIDYKETHIIHFTKEKDNGRYGFLEGITD